MNRISFLNCGYAFKGLLAVTKFSCCITTVNNFSGMSGQSHRFLGMNKYNLVYGGLKFLAQEHFTGKPGIKPRTSYSAVLSCTMKPVYIPQFKCVVGLCIRTGN